jgi:transposase
MGGQEQTGARRRRSYSVEEKRRIVAETLKPGASVSMVARRHDVNANLVFTWRRRYRQSPPILLPVAVTPDLAPVKSAAPKPRAPAARNERIEIELIGGHRIYLPASGDADLIRHVIEALLR